MLRYSLTLFVTLLLTFSLTAQIQNARIEGNVHDSSGAIVPGAKLLIVNTKTQVKAAVEANATGATFRGLLDPYRYLTVGRQAGKQ